MATKGMAIDATRWEGLPLDIAKARIVRPGIVKVVAHYDDCPSAHKKGKQCSTCYIRAQREKEPDTWFHKPKKVSEAQQAAAIRWDNRPGAKPGQGGLWDGFDRVYARLSPLERQRLVIRTCILWGVNVDRLVVS